MAEFPERQASNEQLYHTLDLINDQAAEREYTTGMYYVRARKPTSAEYQFGLVVAKWPKSKWAELSKVELAKTAKMPRKASVPSKIMTLPGAPDPSGSMGFWWWTQRKHGRNRQRGIGHGFTVLNHRPLPFDPIANLRRSDQRRKLELKARLTEAARCDA